jgi:hypothetical protein
MRVEELAAIRVDLARHDERIRDTEEWRAKQNGALNEIRLELKQMREDFGKRPTWGVTVLIGILSTACGSMAVFIITKL